MFMHNTSFNLKIGRASCRERDYTFSKIHTVEEETFGGGKEELGEEERVSLNTLSLSKTKI